jgi:hypothetical protein
VGVESLTESAVLKVLSSEEFSGITLIVYLKAANCKSVPNLFKVVKCNVHNLGGDSHSEFKE